MGGGGGSSSPSYEAEYRWYASPPRPYEGQNEINSAADGLNNQSDFIINGRIRPNESSLRYYQNLNVYYMDLKDRVDAQTDWFLDKYPDAVIERIVSIEKVFERINEYIQQESSGVRQKTYEDIQTSYTNAQLLASKIQAYIERVAYYRRKMQIKREIESALQSRINTYLNGMTTTILQSTIDNLDNLEDYISTNGKIYIGVPPALS
jgi:LPS O-antigen subunit length determinant protein (WzzB/FepE family)